MNRLRIEPAKKFRNVRLFFGSSDPLIWKTTYFSIQSIRSCHLICCGTLWIPMTTKTSKDCEPFARENRKLRKKVQKPNSEEWRPIYIYVLLTRCHFRVLSPHNQQMYSICSQKVKQWPALSCGFKKSWSSSQRSDYSPLLFFPRQMHFSHDLTTMLGMKNLLKTQQWRVGTYS